MKKADFPKPRRDFIVTLSKNENHAPREKQTNYFSSDGLPKLPPKKKYIITMDRSEEPRTTDVTMRYVPSFHRVNVGNKPEVRYPMTSSFDMDQVSSGYSHAMYRSIHKSETPRKEKPAFVFVSISERGISNKPKNVKKGRPHISVEELGDVWYPFLSSHPKYGSKLMVLEQKYGAEIYGTDLPTVNDIQEAERMVLGSLDLQQDNGKPDWRLTYRGGGILNRDPDPAWCGRYVDPKEYDYRPLVKGHQKNERIKVGVKSRYAPTSKEVRFAQNAFNEKFVYTQQADGQYIERSFNPRIQKHTKEKGRYIENSFTPHYVNRNPHFISKDKGYYNANPYDPLEEYNAKYLPPIKRSGKYANVDARVKSFTNVGYIPGGGNKHYPTFKLNWKADAKVSSFQPFKSKSYPNTIEDSIDSDIGASLDVQSHTEIQRVAESIVSFDDQGIVDTGQRNVLDDEESEKGSKADGSTRVPYRDADFVHDDKADLSTQQSFRGTDSKNGGKTDRNSRGSFRNAESDKGGKVDINTQGTFRDTESDGGGKASRNTRVSFRNQGSRVTSQKRSPGLLLKGDRSTG